jgi:hypothetical protein
LGFGGLGVGGWGFARYSVSHATMADQRTPNSRDSCSLPLLWASFFVNDFFVDHGADGADALQGIGQQWASIPVSERFPHRFLEATVPSQRPPADVNTIHGADGADALQGIGQQWASIPVSERFRHRFLEGYGPLAWVSLLTEAFFTPQSRSVIVLFDERSVCFSSRDEADRLGFPPVLTEKKAYSNVLFPKARLPSHDSP